MTDEKDLIERVKRGEARASRELYGRHVGPLYRFLRQHSDDAFLIEEWVQRAFIKAFHKIGSFQQSSKFSTWLFTIAIHEMRSDLRRPTIVAFDSRAVDGWNGLEESPGDFLWEEAMRGSIRELDEAKRNVFLLYEVEGYSHREIASMLEISEGTSRALLCRAKQFLKAKNETKESAS